MKFIFNTENSQETSLEVNYTLEIVQIKFSLTNSFLKISSQD